jgi:hypothetical protein
MQTLEDLFEQAQGIAELNVAKRGGFNCFFVAATRDGNIAIIEAPIRHEDDVDPAEEKKLWARGMRDVFERMGVIRFACATEVWMSSPTWKEQPRKDPQRREGVLILAWDGARTIAGARAIERPHGRPPYLGNLEMQPDEPPKPGGMFDLLPGRLRWSSELPDDEGKVFVTCVPGAPIQVLGRIGEHDGRLYIGRIATPDAGARDFNKEDLARDLAAANMRTKLLDGPDAVELIADIQRKRPDLIASAERAREQQGSALQ